MKRRKRRSSGWEAIVQEIENSDYIYSDSAELISKLTDHWNAPLEVKQHSGEAWGEYAFDTLDALCDRREPRAAEIIVTFACHQNGVGGLRMDEAVTNLGMYSVPYLLEYMDADRNKFFLAIELLNAIAAAHPEESYGIVKHIALPKIEAETQRGGRYVDAFRHYIDEEYGKLKAFVGEEP